LGRTPSSGGGGGRTRHDLRAVFPGGATPAGPARQESRDASWGSKTTSRLPTATVEIHVEQAIRKRGSHGFPAQKGRGRGGPGCKSARWHTSLQRQTICAGRGELTPFFCQGGNRANRRPKPMGGIARVQGEPGVISGESHGIQERAGSRQTATLWVMVISCGAKTVQGMPRGAGDLGKGRCLFPQRL